ncbi:MAG: serine hydrolase [Lewinellaceae bacterium]|nr:serine hydrolase [Saprospiraceae bacterium]MCB9345152.1 serine hydrolase [Lewinellaceae bacterium]
MQQPKITMPGFVISNTLNLISKTSLIIFTFLLIATGISAQPYVLRHNLTGAQYQTEFNKWTGKGYRLSQVSGYSANGQDRYAALFEKKNGPVWTAKHGMTPAQYQNEVNTLVERGYRPIQVSGYPSGSSGVKYAAIFIKENAPPPYVAKHGMTANAYQIEFNKWTGQGYRLIDISAYTVMGTDYYAAIWEKSPGPKQHCRHLMSSAKYQSEFNTMSSQGYRIVKVSGYSVNNKPYFAAIWEKSGGPALSARHELHGPQNYQDEAERQYYMGFRPAWVNGYTVNNTDSYAGIWTNSDPFKANEIAAVDALVKQYMDDNAIPGLSIAFAKDGKLKFARTYGWADKEAGEKVAPRHTFRIASVSKPITATAIMKLEETNKLELTDKIFGNGAILGNTYGNNAYTNWLKQINVDHLLQHTPGGWDQDGDPITQNQGWNMGTYITKTLDNYPLDNQPGQVYDYSNFGFALLGRVIETKTGKTYENWVKDNILTPCGIKGMSIGGSTLAQRKPNEVKYYGQDAYFYNIPRMDSHGGWIASPIDLVRFLVHVDQSNSVPDILSPGSLTSMFTKSPKNGSYCRGWALVQGSGSLWHNGALPSTLSEMKQTSDGYSIAILMNTRPAKDKDFNGGDMGSLLGNIKKAITYWPNHDLF